MLRIGKQIGGPTNIIPEFALWGGTIWINSCRRSLMISLPKWVCDFLLMIGIDPYDG